MTDKQTQSAVKEETAKKEEAAKPEFIIQRIYIKDVSFEAPGAPDIFRAEWSPQVDFDLATNFTKLSDSVYEVILKITVNVKVKE